MTEEGAETTREDEEEEEEEAGARRREETGEGRQRTRTYALWCRESATPASPPPHPTPSDPPVVSRKCNACHTLRASDG